MINEIVLRFDEEQLQQILDSQRSAQAIHDPTQFLPAVMPRDFVPLSESGWDAYLTDTGDLKWSNEAVLQQAPQPSWKRLYVLRDQS